MGASCACHATGARVSAVCDLSPGAYSCARSNGGSPAPYLVFAEPVVFIVSIAFSPTLKAPLHPRLPYPSLRDILSIHNPHHRT